MENILDKERTTDYDLIQLASKMGYPLRGVFSKNELPSKPLDGAYIVNLQDSDDGHGTHWVGLWRTPKCSVYFDTFGIEPPFEIVDFCKCPHLKYSDRQIQAIDEGMCGQWVSLFLYYISTDPKNIGGAKTIKQRYDAFMKNFKSLS